jgi:hypothetical protein
MTSETVLYETGQLPVIGTDPITLLLHLFSHRVCILQVIGVIASLYTSTCLGRQSWRENGYEAYQSQDKAYDHVK